LIVVEHPKENAAIKEKNGGRRIDRRIASIIADFVKRSPAKS
jgi:hypothetical protein